MSLAVMTDGGSGGGGGGVKLAIMASNSISTARRGAFGPPVACGSTGP